MARLVFSVLCICFLLNGFTQQSGLKPLGILLEEVAYPFPVHFFQVTTQDQKFKMAYMDVQPQAPNGRVVILLHGKNFNGAYWEQTAKALGNVGYRVIIPDQVGFGKSSKPSALQYSFQLLAQQTKYLLDSLGITRTAVLGHSMGGMLAARFALMYPQMTEKLILLNPIGLEDYKVKVPYQSVDDWYKNELKQNYAAIKKYQQENYYGGEWKPAYDPWANMLAGWTLSADYPKIAWNSALTYDMIFTQPVVYELENIKSPTLLIIGLSDRTALGKDRAPEELKKTMGNYPVLATQTAQKIKGSVLVKIENTGHLPHIQSFDRFVKPLLDFLAR